MSDMRTALKQALASPNAQVRVKSLNEQCWLWLRDHPRTSSRQLSSVFKCETSRPIWDLVDRGMLTSELVSDKRVCQKAFKLYSVIGKEYDLLPRKKKQAKPVKSSNPSAAPLSILLADHLPMSLKPLKIVVNADFDIEGLTLGQARKLYAQLREIFK